MAVSWQQPGILGIAANDRDTLVDRKGSCAHEQSIYEVVSQAL